MNLLPWLLRNVITVKATSFKYIPSTANAYHKVREIGCVETQNICVKKLIVPPKIFRLSTPIRNGLIRSCRAL